MDMIRSRKFGELVRRARLAQGKTQADLAGEVGPDPETGSYLGGTQVSRVEAGQKEMSRWLIDRIATVLDIDRIEVLEATTGQEADALRELLDARQPNVAIPDTPTKPRRRPAAASADAPAAGADPGRRSIRSDRWPAHAPAPRPALHLVGRAA